MVKYKFFFFIQLTLIGLAATLISCPARADWLDYVPFLHSGLDYSVAVQGVDADTVKWIDSLGLLAKNHDNPPANPAELESEGIALQNRLQLALKAKGYYDALIQYRLDKNTKPSMLRYSITPGKRYTLRAVNMNWLNEALPLPQREAGALKTGDFVDAGIINQEAAKLLVQAGKDTCLLSLVIVPRLELDTARAQAILMYDITHGPKANFGATRIKNNMKVDKKVIERSVTWKKGSCYNEAEITKTRSALIATQLFSTVNIQADKEPDSSGEAGLTIEVRERVQRTVTLGASYATDQGYGVQGGWEHRDFSGDGDKLNTNLVLAEQQQTLSATDRIPAFMRKDQLLVLSGSIDHQDTDAYKSDSITAGAAVERRISKTLNSGLGAAYLLTHTQDSVKGNEDYGLISTPGFLEYDTRDNAQDATKGVYARAALTPYVDTFSLKTDFLKTLFTAQTYISQEKLPGKPTLALRGSYGTILGASSTSLPSDLRFYAGGGGSVRGYAYQSISPYFNGSPIGGSSLVLATAEVRVHITQTIGLVAFVDGGNAYAETTPDLSAGFYWAAGLGVRYYSALGPIRLDVGIPLNGRNIDNSGVDQKGYALYVSIGQAF